MYVNYIEFNLNFRNKKYYYHIPLNDNDFHKNNS